MENKIKRKIIIGLSKEYELAVKTVYSYYDLIVDYLNKTGLGNMCETEFLLRCLEHVLQERSSIIISDSYVEETRDIKEAIVPDIDIDDRYDFNHTPDLEEIEWRSQHELDEDDNIIVVETLDGIESSCDNNYTDDLALTISKVVSEELGIDFDYRAYEDSLLTDEDNQKRWFNTNYYNIPSMDIYRKYEEENVEITDDMPIEDSCLYFEYSGDSINGAVVVDRFEEIFDEDKEITELLTRICKYRETLEEKLYLNKYIPIKSYIDDLNKAEAIINGEVPCLDREMTFEKIVTMVNNVENFIGDIEGKDEAYFKTRAKAPVKVLKDPYLKEYIVLDK